MSNNLYDIKQNFSPALCRAARGLVNLSQGDLAARAHVSRSTLADFERGTRRPVHNNLLAIARTLEEEGVIFLSADSEYGTGVRFRDPAVTS